MAAGAKADAMPVPLLPVAKAAVTKALASAEAVIAARICAPVEFGAPVASVPRFTVMVGASAVPPTATVNGEAGVVVAGTAYAIVIAFAAELASTDV
jgi:hypothetical protein